MDQLKETQFEGTFLAFLRQNDMETLMKKPLYLFFILLTIILASCSPEMVPAPVEELTVAAPAATESLAAPAEKTYSNSAFGLSFQYPADWYGPDEYISDQTLRVEIGSDVVYPYGTDRTQQTPTKNNSYSIVVQYMKANQNPVWQESYQSLANLAAGESVSDARSKLIKVGYLALGQFHGIEYIATLADTASTEPVYSRQVILFDDASNVISILGSPNNVAVPSGTPWLDVYKQIDTDNTDIFHQLVKSITIQ